MTVSLIIDIGSSSVGAALVSASKGVAPKILFSTRAPIALQNNSDRKDSLAAMVSALDPAIKAVSDKHIPAHKSHIFFSSPWYVSETNILKTDHDAPVTITRHAIEQIAKEAEKNFVAGSKSDGEVVEHRIIRTRLNGYETQNPYNKKAKSVELAFYISIVNRDVLESVRRVVGKYFHIRNNEVSSFPLAAWNTISRILPAERDFLIVDVRGEMTDVSLVTDGALIKNLSFPQGKDSLIKSVVDGSGQSPTAALSLLDVALHEHGGPAVQNDVMRFTETFKQAWTESYIKTLQSMSVVPTIFLTADSDVEIFFENALNEVKNGSSLHPIKRLNFAEHLDASSVPTDPFLALESIFVTII